MRRPPDQLHAWMVDIFWIKKLITFLIVVFQKWITVDFVISSQFIFGRSQKGAKVFDSVWMYHFVCHGTSVTGSQRGSLHVYWAARRNLAGPCILFFSRPQPREIYVLTSWTFADRFDRVADRCFRSFGPPSDCVDLIVWNNNLNCRSQVGEVVLSIWVLALLRLLVAVVACVLVALLA